MASEHVLLAAVAVAAALLPLAMAAEIPVGDEFGWQPEFNYDAWAGGMEFRVGDKLVFNYTPGEHNVVEVGEVAFSACIAVGGNNASGTGHDVVPLKTSGRKWFICTKGNNCLRGQKLQIDVIPAIVTEAASLPPSPPRSSADGVRPSAFHAAAAAATMMIAVF